MKNKNTVVRILFALFELVLVQLHLPLVDPVEEGDLAAKGVVQLPPGSAPACRKVSAPQTLP